MERNLPGSLRSSPDDSPLVTQAPSLSGTQQPGAFAFDLPSCTSTTIASVPLLVLPTAGQPSQLCSTLSRDADIRAAHVELPALRNQKRSDVRTWSLSSVSATCFVCRLAEVRPCCFVQQGSHTPDS
eukprot:1920677-Amphidinium_carterae.2